MIVNLHYYGLTYEELSREGARLVKQARDTGNWFSLPEALSQLRMLMNESNQRQYSRDRLSKK
jgi:hypothetical protein